MPYGNFYYGKTGFFFKKSGVIGNRYNPSLGAICNQPQDVNNRFVPGSGVGASSTAQRRAKLIQAYRTVSQKDGKGPQHLGVFAQGGSNAYALNWGLYNSPYVSPPPTVSQIPIILSAPTNLLQTSSTSTSITFTFTPPNSQGTTVTNYEYSTNGGSTFTAFSPAQTFSPLTISGLTVETSYNIVLRAVNQYGAGTNSTAVSMSTTIAVPGPPTGLYLQFSQGDPTIAIIQFTPGTGTSITGYQYSIDNGTTFSIVTSYTTNTFTLTDLTNNLSYNILLRALNAGGPGTASGVMKMVVGDYQCANTSNQGIFLNNNAYPALVTNGQIDSSWYVYGTGVSKIKISNVTSDEVDSLVYVTLTSDLFTGGQTYYFYIPSTP